MLFSFQFFFFSRCRDCTLRCECSNLELTLLLSTFFIIVASWNETNGIYNPVLPSPYQLGIITSRPNCSQSWNIHCVVIERFTHRSSDLPKWRWAETTSARWSEDKVKNTMPCLHGINLHPLEFHCKLPGYDKSSLINSKQCAFFPPDRDVSNDML